MILGSVDKINLSTSSFERMIIDGSLYVDKTKMIENFFNTGSDVMLITRQRRIGKSLNMDMLRCFLTSQKDYRYLFEGTYIKTSPVWEKAHSAPVFHYDLKTLNEKDYEVDIWEQTIRNLYSFTNPANLDGYAKMLCDSLLDKTTSAVRYLQKLT